VGVNYSSNDVRSEEENPDPLSHYTNYASAENSGLPEAEADGDTYDHELGMGLEDILPETPDGIEADAEPLGFSKKISHEGKEILKSSLIATLNNSKSKKVPWCTWRVCNVAIDDLYNSKQQEMDSDDMEDEEYCTILIDSSPLSDCDTPDKIVISSPCFGSHDRVQISSGAAWYLDILTSFGPVCHEIYSGGTPLDPK